MSSLQREQWKPIPEFPRYEVSNFGRVRFAGGVRANRWGEYIAPPKMLTCHPYEGYRKVSLYKGKKKFTRRVCRLVLMAFHGCPSGGQECNHKNGDRSDDRIENLEWVTKSENGLHRSRVLGNVPCKGERHPKARLTVGDVKFIREQNKAGVSQRALARQFETNQGHISAIVTRRIWRSVK